MAWREMVYQYDGSFDGLLCCIYESYTNKELPTAIYRDEEDEPCLFAVRSIVTDRAHAQRIYRSLRKISPEVGPFLRHVYLTDMSDKEMAVYRFVAKLYREGAPLLRRLSDDAYYPLLKAVRAMFGEVEKLRGFVRFSEFDGVLAAEIEPKNRVLPLLRHHFCERYRNESFFIYDRTHHEALLYSNRVGRIVPLEDFKMAEPDVTEVGYRRLWRRFYDTIAVRERENPKLCMTHMPKRYWGTLTEFFDDTDSATLPPAWTPASAIAPDAPSAKPAPAIPQAPAPPAPASGP